jgi:excisionase family DNA binding protein
MADDGHRRARRDRPGPAVAKPHMDQLLLTVAQCCQMAAIGRTKFYELVASGDIPVRKVGKKTLVAAADLKRWAERLPAIEVKATPPARRESRPS